MGGAAAAGGVNVLVEAKGAVSVATADGVLSPAACAELVATAEARGYDRATSRGPKFGEAARDHGRQSFTDAALAQRIFDALAPALAQLRVGRAEPVGLNPRIRVYKYAQGEHFGAHVDDSETVPGLGTTEYTLLLYICADGLVGGETAFFGRRGAELCRVAPAAGRCLLHRHGPQCLEHSSLPVQKGTKIVLRSDVAFAEPGSRRWR